MAVISVQQTKLILNAQQFRQNYDFTETPSTRWAQKLGFRIGSQVKEKADQLKQSRMAGSWNYEKPDLKINTDIIQGKE